MACTGAAVFAFRCGGDDLQQRVREDTRPVRAQYIGVQKPSEDEDIWRMASEDASLDDE